MQIKVNFYNRLRCPQELFQRQEEKKVNPHMTGINVSTRRSEEDRNHSLPDHDRGMIISRSNQECPKDQIAQVPSYLAEIRLLKNHKELMIKRAKYYLEPNLKDPLLS